MINPVSKYNQLFYQAQGNPRAGQGNAPSGNQADYRPTVDAVLKANRDEAVGPKECKT